MKKILAQQPRVETVNIGKLRFLRAIEIILMCLLVFTGLHILIFYITSLFNPYIIETSSVKYAIYITIGCFFYLFVHKKAIDDQWGPKNTLNKA